MNDRQMIPQPQADVADEAVGKRATGISGWDEKIDDDGTKSEMFEIRDALTTPFD